MTEQNGPPSGMQMVAVDGIPVTATLADGQIRIHLPFAVDPHALSRQLIREGYALAHEPDTPDTQGWGDFFDPGAYYPYWVYPDPDFAGRSVFAFYPHPEDVIDLGGGAKAIQLGKRSLRLVQRWVPVLNTLRQGNPGVSP